MPPNSVPIHQEDTLQKRKGKSGGSTSSGGTRGNSPSSVTVAGTYGRTTTTSGGSKKSFIIPAGQPFAGRIYGGATRGAIWGTAAFGSGYLGILALSDVQGRNFGFGFWPLYRGYGYLGSDEYGPKDNSSRPGGPQIASSFNPPYLDATMPPQYLIYGDNSSVAFISEYLVYNCSAVFVANETTTTNQTLLPLPLPEYDLQYYRESSFVLSNYFENYTSPSPPLDVNDTKSQVEPFLYPTVDRNLTFQDCVNWTIASNLPIANDAASCNPRGAWKINGKDVHSLPVAGLVIGQLIGKKWGFELGTLLGVIGMVSLSV